MQGIIYIISEIGKCTEWKMEEKKDRKMQVIKMQRSKYAIKD